MSGCALGLQSAGGSSRPVEFLDALLPQSGQTQFGRDVRKSEPASGWYVQDLCNVKTITWHSAYFVAHGWLVMCKKLYAAYALSVLVPILTRIALQILLNEGGFDSRKTQVFAISSHSDVKAGSCAAPFSSFAHYWWLLVAKHTKSNL